MSLSCFVFAARLKTSRWSPQYNKRGPRLFAVLSLAVHLPVAFPEPGVISRDNDDGYDYFFCDGCNGCPSVFKCELLSILPSTALAVSQCIVFFGDLGQEASTSMKRDGLLPTPS